MSERDFPLPLNAASTQLPVSAELPPTQTATAAAPKAESRRWLELLKWAFSFPAMLGTFLVGRVFYEGRNFVVDPDAWWHIKVGQDILRTHQFPTTDPYSWTVHGHPWIAYEWLGEVMLGLVYRAGGVVALDAFLIGFGAIIVLLLYGLASMRSGNSKSGFVSALILASLAFATFTLRPQMFGYVFLVLTLAILLQFKKGVAWPVWFLPVIFLAWVNTHGSFIIGMGIVALYLCAGLFSFRRGSVEAIAWTRKQRLQLETVLLLSLAALPITPYGTKLAIYPFDMAFSQPINVANVMEWKPLPFDLLGGKLFLGLVVIFFVLQLLFQFTWQLEELVLTVAGAAMACLHVRFVMLFVPFFAPVFAAMLARWLPPYQAWKDKYVLNAILIVTLIGAMVHYRPTEKSLADRVSKTYPVGAVQYLQTHPISGKVLNTYGYGGYLILSGIPTFIDGRGDLFERGGVFGDYIYLTQFKPGAFELLRTYTISACLVDRDEPLSTALLASSSWQRVYVDRTSALYVRTAPAQSSAGN